MSPSPFGSIAHSMASEVRFVLPATSPKTLSAYSCAPGATPTPMEPGTPSPAALPATCEPWPLTSSGSGSGAGVEPATFALYVGPAKSNPPTTFAVGNVPASMMLRLFDV